MSEFGNGVTCVGDMGAETGPIRFDVVGAENLATYMVGDYISFLGRFDPNIIDLVIPGRRIEGIGLAALNDVAEDGADLWPVSLMEGPNRLRKRIHVEFTDRVTGALRGIH